MDRILCPCCGEYCMQEKFDICPVCGWENDPVQNQDPDLAGGANKKSLNDYREEFLILREEEEMDYESE